MADFRLPKKTKERGLEILLQSLKKIYEQQEYFAAQIGEIIMKITLFSIS